MIYLVVVLVVGARNGLVPALGASVVCFLCYNFFFTDAALHASTIQTPRTSSRDLLFFLGAVFTGTLAGRLRAQVATMRTNQKRTEMLYDFAKRIAAKSDLDDVLYASAYHIAATLSCRSLILMPDSSGKLEQVRVILDRGRARSARRRRRAVGLRQARAGRGRDRHPADVGVDVRRLPAQAPLGVVGLQFKDPRRGADPEVRRLLQAVRTRSPWRSSGPAWPATSRIFASKPRARGCAPRSSTR